MSSPASGSTMTYYEILQVEPTASELDIKKAYRRLALKFHPDRNQGRFKDEFQAINAAYEVLSDKQRRAEYDRSRRLRSGANVQPYSQQTAQSHHQQSFTNPYDRFNDLFSNDPFFHSAFRDMNDDFARRFQNQNRSNAPLPKRKKGWGAWFLEDCLGINFTMTTHVTTADGTVTASQYQSTPKNGEYSDQKMRRYVDSRGRQIEVRSLEKNGNRIENTYGDGVLVQRLVNGKVEPVGRLSG